MCVMPALSSSMLGRGRWCVLRCERKMWMDIFDYTCIICYASIVGQIKSVKKKYEDIRQGYHLPSAGYPV